MDKVAAFLTKIQFAFENNLPGISAHQEMIVGNRPLRLSDVNDIESYREAAVAIICFPFDSEIHVILTERTKYEGNHSGQISFPGGKMELSDQDLEAAARREAFEEIAWQLDSTNLIGELTQLVIPISKYVVTPFLYFTNSIQTFKPDPREVESVFHFPVNLLKDEHIKKKKTIDLGMGMKLKDAPYFEINNQVVWGATAIILSELKAMI